MAIPVVYAVIKFRPYTETEEFANIGVVACAPDAGFFAFKLEKNFTRITSFFKELDSSLPRKAAVYIDDELQRVKKYAATCNSTTLLMLFNEAVKTKEGLICYGDPKVAMTNDPELKLESAYQHFVNHSFTKERSHTQKLEIRMKQMLSDNNLSTVFTRKEISNGIVKAAIPFVKKYESDYKAAIKPISLIGMDSNSIIDIGAKWCSKFRWLTQDNTLDPRNILVPIEMPIDDTKELNVATSGTINELRHLNIRVVEASHTDEIMTFATAV